MGTSSPFGGASGQSALLPTWLQGPATMPAALTPLPAPGHQPPPASQQPLPNVPTPPAPRPTQPVPGASDRFTTPRANFSRFARSGGSDRRSLGRAVSGYVSSSTGGAQTAAQRMGSSRGAAGGLVNFLNNVTQQGAASALRTLNLNHLAGRPIEEIFTGLADVICPEGGTIDEGIARDAFVETIADLASAGITDVDGLTPAQIQTVFELYATHAIMARICNDIGTKIVHLPSDPRAAVRVEAQLRDFIRRCVADAVHASGVNIQSLTPATAGGLVTQVYEAAFEILQTAGDAEDTP